MSLKTITKVGSEVAAGVGFTDAFSLRISASDNNVVPVDAATFLLGFLLADSNAGQTETAQLKFPAPDFADTSIAPADANTFTLKIWLSGGTATANGVTNVANSNGENNETVATIRSAALGTANPSITSALGANVPAGVSVVSAIYRGWFESVNDLVTSNGNIIMRSIGSLFTDKVMFTNAGLNTTVDHLTGDFTYNLVANGIDTLAKIQSCQVIHNTHDAAAGVTPHVLTVDAGAIELSAAFV